MADCPPPSGHNGGPSLDDPTPQRSGRCRDCRHWQPPPESLERDYEFFRLGLSRRRVKRPTGSCDRVLLGTSRIPAFSGTTGHFSCRNFEPASQRPPSTGGGFVTIWVGNPQQTGLWSRSLPEGRGIEPDKVEPARRRCCRDDALSGLIEDCIE